MMSFAGNEEMRILLINEVLGTTSTGKISAQIAEQLEMEGNEVKVAFGRWASVPEKYKRFAYYIGSDVAVKMHGILTRLFDAQGLGSRRATKKFVEWAQKYNPDLLWLHNIHGYYINYPILFNWIKSRPKMKVQWTLHDCWAFTGHCVYFTRVGCDKWKTGCQNCPQKKEYPASIGLDGSRKNYEKKKLAFTGIKGMTLITPSKWLADLTRHSFLKDYPVKVSYNEIDRTIFKPTKSDFREKHELIGKRIVLGVSNAWLEPRKGLKDFYELRKILDKNYVIVLVGLPDEMIEDLPEGIIGIKKIANSHELAGLYSTADVLVNPTYEDNYPTVNLEAEACGCPVITYDVGGSRETIKAPRSLAIKVGDIDELCTNIKNVAG